MATQIAQIAGFNRHSKPLGLSELEYDADIIGEAYWGNVPSQSEVSLSKAVMNAQKRFADANVMSAPLLPTIDEDFIYKAIFEYGTHSGISDGKQYSEETEKLRHDFLDKNAKAVDDIKKATTTAEGMIHTIYDEKVAYLYKRPYPFQALLPVVSNKGKVAAWDAMSPYGSMGSAYFGTEDATLTESDIVSHQRYDTVKYMYSVGRVTRAAQYAGLTAIPARDLMMVRVDAAQDALRALRERSLLGVDRNIMSTSFHFQDAGTLEYKGINQLVKANTDNSMYTSGSGCDNWDKISKKLDESYNKMTRFNITPNLALCDLRTFSIIRRGLFEYTRTEPIQTFVAGISKISLVFPGEGGLPLVAHPFLPMNAGNGNIFLLQTGALERRTLWADMYDDLAKINLSHKFVVSAAETLIDKTDVDGTSSLLGGVFGID